MDALVLLARFHGIAVNTEDIRHQFDLYGAGLDLVNWQLAAKSLGFKVRVSNKSISRLSFINLPVLVWDEENKQHFILAKIDNRQNKYLIHDLALKQPIVLGADDFAQRYTGQIILLTSRASVLGQLAKFDFTWFIPAIIKYRRILYEVIAISLVLQILALITPLFFQVVMDKVLVHQGFNTLNVIAVGLSIIIFI